VPTPEESALLTILGVEIPGSAIGTSSGESVREDVVEGRTFDEFGTQLTGPPAAKAGCCPPPPACPTGVDPDLIEEQMEARLDAALFEED